MQASSQMDRRGHDVRHASITSAYSRGRTAIHSSICRLRAVVALMTVAVAAGAIGSRRGPAGPSWREPSCNDPPGRVPAQAMRRRLSIAAIVFAPLDGKEINWGSALTRGHIDRG